MKVHVETVQFKADQKLLEFIDRKIAKLDTFFDRIIEVEVILKLENSGQVRDKVVEVKVHVPGDILFVSETDKAFEAAVELAVDSLKRQLKRHKEKIRSY
ncbi:MAG: ribosome-associated translation inhibitor RaiA [Saprospiraceae bacterium]|nr:ribosome-associated translation inhibitor RaiA [Saprospiraceae bacterium]